MKDIIEDMRKSKRLNLTKQHLFWHYSIVPFYLIVPILLGGGLLKMYLFNSYDSARSPKELISFSIIFLILAILTYVRQTKKLLFNEYCIQANDEEFRSAVEGTARQLKWSVHYYSPTYVKAYRSWNWSASWGEMITIIRDKDTILINSICDPNTTSGAVSFGWNSKNVETFVRNLE